MPKTQEPNLTLSLTYNWKILTPHRLTIKIFYFGGRLGTCKNAVS